MTIGECIVKFASWQKFSKKANTVASYRVHLMHFALFLRNPEIEKVTYEDVLDYLKGMTELGWDKNSFMVKTIAFRKFFQHLKKIGLKVFDYELIPLAERDYKFPKVAVLEDYDKVLAIIPDSNDPRHIRNKAILMLFRDTGMRLGEAISLNIEDINTKDMSALIRTEKAKTLHPIRKVFWTFSTNQALIKWVNKREHLNIEENQLFVSVCGVKKGQRINRSGVTEMLRRYSHEAGLKYVLNSHSLRHLFGRELAEQDASENTISTLLGHSNIQSSRVYTILGANKMEEQYNKYKRK